MSEDLDVILTPAEAAKLAKASLKTVYRAIGSGALVASPIGRGRRYRITRENFWRWLNSPVVGVERPRSVRSQPGKPVAGSLAKLRAIERGAS